MDRKKLIKIAGTISILCFGLQSYLISNGLLGISILSLKKLCTCDHSLVSHNHANPHPEDEYFSDKSDFLSLSKPPNHLTKKESNPDSRNPIDPSEICHTSAGDIPVDGTHTSDHSNGEPHFCPHETSKQNVENTSLTLNTLQIGNDVFSITLPVVLKSYSVIYIHQSIHDGYSLKLIKPPRPLT